MRDMIDGLLQYSGWRPRVPLEPVDLNEVLDVVYDDTCRCGSRRATRTSRRGSLPRVMGDLSQLRQVFQNLLSNAIEYSGDEPPRIDVSAERDGADWVVSVRDQGVGIDPDDADRIFEVFQRLHTHDEHPGPDRTSPLCQRIVERHGGDIWVDAEPGEGRRSRSRCRRRRPDAPVRNRRFRGRPEAHHSNGSRPRPPTYVEQLGTGDPEIAVVGGIHGDEPCGEHAVRTLLDERPAVQRPVKFVLANETRPATGTSATWRPTSTARFLATRTRRPTRAVSRPLSPRNLGCTVLGLHSTQSYEGMFALVDEIGPTARSVCPHLSIDAVVETTGANEGRIYSVIPEAIEVECGFQGSAQAAENAVQVTREFLAATGVLPEEGGPRQTDLPVFRLRGPIPSAPPTRTTSTSRTSRR